MKKLTYLFILTIIFTSAAFAGYTTPGTGVKLNLDNLVTNSGGVVTFTSGQYFVNDTVKISALDTLMITTNATVKFAANTYLAVRGVLIINPPTGVLFTAQNTTNGYLGMRVDTSSSTLLRKLTFEYAVSMKFNSSNPTLDSCIIQYNNNSTSTTFGTSAVYLFNANPLITNCKFLYNQRAAISGGANIANAPKIIGCYFLGNVTTHYNSPQINLGQSGTDTVKILNNQILRADTNSGGIGFLPIGNVYAVITGNTIKNNRYGITINGSTNIFAILSYNTIDSNNTQGSPTLGGSGIAFTGGSASAVGQNTIVTGNYIRWNLWGITIQNRSRPNLGNLSNSDTSDNGKNAIYGNNNNSTTPRIDLYNNSVDTIFAQNNYWGFTNADSVEAHIYHFPDNPALGPVFYTPFALPVELVSFNSGINENVVTLSWITATEKNNKGFEVEKRSTSGWNRIGFVQGNGTSTEKNAYSFKDKLSADGKYSYRLKQIDYDGTVSYSGTVEVNFISPKVYYLGQNYPNPFNPSTQISYQLASDSKVSLKIFNIIGEEVKTLVSENQTAGKHLITLNGSDLSSGVYIYKIEARGNNGSAFISSKKLVLLK